MAETKVAATGILRTARQRRSLALLFFAGVAMAQDAAPPVSDKPVAPPKISYVDGQLRIDAFGSTLADVLATVASLTGVNIDIPAGARNERMPIVELGPGPARQVLASLLSDSNFDYLIQASNTDPDKIQSVLLMPREKKGGATNVAEAAPIPSRGPFGRVAQPEPANDTPATAQPEATLSSQPSVAPPDPPATPPSMSGGAFPIPLAQPGTSPGAMTPPPVLNQQNITQQLQQMYQQRMQMIQQGQAVPTTVRQ